MRRTFIAAAALAACAATPAAASAAHTFTGGCSITGTVTHGATWDEMTGGGVCTGRLDGGARRTFLARYHVQRASISTMVRPFGKPVLVRLAAILADGGGRLQLDTREGSAVIPFRSTQGLAGDVARGALGGRGLGIVGDDGHGRPLITYTFSALAG